jgi:hypothetical protein
MKTFATITSLVLSFLSQAQSQKTDSTLRYVNVTVRSESQNGKVKTSDKTYVFDFNQSYVLEPRKDDEWLSEAIDHKSCKCLKDWQDKGDLIEINAEKFNKRKTKITYSIPLTQHGVFTITENDKKITSVGVHVEMIYEPAFIAPIRDTLKTFSDIPMCVTLDPFKGTNKKRAYRLHYIFQVSHDFIYCIDRNYTIRYTMEMTRKEIFDDHIEVYAKKFDDNAKEEFFYVPLNQNGEFVAQSSKGQIQCSNFDVKILTEKDFYNE